MNNLKRNIIILLSIIIFLIGQYFIFYKNNYLYSFIFTFISLLIFILIFYIDNLNFKQKMLFYINKIKNFVISIKLQKERKIAKKEEGPQIDVLKSGSFNFEIKIHKNIFLILLIILLFISQFLLFKQQILKFFILLLIMIYIFIYYIKLKVEHLKISLNFKKNYKLIIFVLGLFGLVAGWILLIKSNVRLQEIGTFITVLGVILCFLGLPENPDKRENNNLELKEEILLEDHKIFNTYLFKIIMFVLMSVFIILGNKFIVTNDKNLIAIYFYFIAIVFLFFGLPLINYRQKSLNEDNFIIKIIKILLILFAFNLALKGQNYFTKNNINEAVKLFFIATFIIAFIQPIYKNNTKQYEKVPVYIEVVFLLFVIILAVYFRLYEIDKRPFGLENDEMGGFLNNYLAVISGKFTPNVGNHGIGFNITSFYHFLFGHIDRVIVRLVGITIGIFSVPIFYFFIRRAINVPAAMFTTIIFAVLRWNVHYGRSAHFMHLTVLGAIAGLYFMIVALQRRDKLSYFFSGLSFGITWHGALTGWLVVVPLLTYFIFKSINEKFYLRRNYIGLFAFFLGFWIFTSIVIHNYFISTRIYFARIQEVSVFSKDPNAPRNVGKGIVDNTQRVLLMFNHQGDSRQRNSGGFPYEPTIDFTSAIFFAIGFIYCMYYSRHYLFYIMVMLFFSQAAGSIFSIEAPSAMRAIGTMTPMMFFIGVAFNVLFQSFKNLFGEKFTIRIIYPLLLILLLYKPVKDNYKQIFDRWINGLDELSTAAGMYSAELGLNYRIILFTETFYPGHPPYAFYRRDYYKVNNSSCPVDILSAISLIKDENFAILHIYDLWEMLSYWQRKFPESTVDDVDHHYFNKSVTAGGGLGRFFYGQKISNQEIQKIRGLKGTYYYSDGSIEVIQNDDAVFNDVKRNKIPYKVIWEGKFLLPQYGEVSFNKTGNANIKLYINNKKIEWGDFYSIPKGLNKIKIIAERKNFNENFSISYLRKEINKNNILANEKLTKLNYFIPEFMPEGLRGYFYSGTAWEESSLAWQEIDSYIYFPGVYLGSYYTLKWVGQINIKEDNYYRIYTQNNNYARVVIDDKWYIESGAIGNEKKAMEFLSGMKAQSSNGYFLTKGKHKIEIYGIKSHTIKLYWQKGQAGMPELMPPEILIPDLTIYD